MIEKFMLFLSSMFEKTPLYRPNIDDLIEELEKIKLQCSSC